MSKEGDHQSFYSILYEVLNDRKPISVLINHPEFQKLGRQICCQIAGKDGGDDLFQKACLRLLTSLDPHNIESERDFFRWFSIVARNEHINEMRRMANTETCAEKTKQWPDDSGDVSPGEMEEFLAHIDECPYHMEILRIEEEEIRSLFRKASGLDSHGRILRGAELAFALAKQERGSKNWKEAARRKKLPFSHISLYNGGKEIASCGNFFDFTKHVSLNELDTRAGIQICGINDSDVNEDVLLGFYPLAGVRHEGEEQFLHLSNGYTVGLRIKQLGDSNFELHFRCVETGIIEEERARENENASETPRAIDHFKEANNPFVSHAPSGVRPDSSWGTNNWLPPPLNGQAGALYASLAVLLLISVSVVILAYKGVDQARNVTAGEATPQHVVRNMAPSNFKKPCLGYLNDALRGYSSDDEGQLVVPSKSPVSETPHRGSVKDTSALRRRVSILKRLGSSSQSLSRRLPHDAGRVHRNSPAVHGARGPATDDNSQPPSEIVAQATPKPNTRVKVKEKAKMAVWRLLLYANATRSTNYTILLTGTHELFGETAVNVMNRRKIPFEYIHEKDVPQTKLTIDMDVYDFPQTIDSHQRKFAVGSSASRAKIEKKQSTVIVFVTIYSGHRIDGGPITGEGANLDMAYGDAFLKIIEPVFEDEKKASGKSQSSSIRQEIDADSGRMMWLRQALLSHRNENSVLWNQVDSPQPLARQDAFAHDRTMSGRERCRKYR